MKNFLISFLLIGWGLTSMAQPPVVTINDIQFVSATDLANCMDRSQFLANEMGFPSPTSTLRIGDTVTVYGRVVMDAQVDPDGPGGQSPTNNAFAAGGRNIWIQEGSGGPWSGLDIFTNEDVASVPLSPNDILELAAQDSVKIEGIVARFGNETELLPLTVEVVGQATDTVNYTTISLGDLNDDQQENQLPTGEQWEGVYVELTDVSVVDVQFFSGGDRVSFVVQDASGNVANIFGSLSCPASGDFWRILCSTNDRYPV